jgi:hypothetical protein
VQQQELTPRPPADRRALAASTDPTYTYTIPVGVELEKLPGAALLLGTAKKLTTADITLVPALVKVRSPLGCQRMAAAPVKLLRALPQP